MANETKEFDSEDIEGLRLLLKPPVYNCPDDCSSLAYNESWLRDLLKRYGSVQAAAYAGCIILARECGAKLADGTELPDMQSYWLRMAKLYRPSGGRCVGRADEDILPLDGRGDDK